MICPCKSRIDCGGDDNPFAGFNSDADDCCTKIGVQYGVGGVLPALGSNWVNSNCVVFADACDQDQADSFALSGYMHCVALNNRTPPAFDFVDPPDVPTPWDVDVFGNELQTCSVLCPDGLLFSFTVKEDQFFALSQIEADRMAHSFACKQLAINQVCMSSLVPNECCLSQTYTSAVSASGTFGPFTFSLVSGSVPPGLSLTQVSGSALKLSGNPTTSGVFTFTIQATDSHGNFMIKSYTLNIVSISTGAIPSPTVGTEYSFDLTLSGSLAAPAQWSIASGSLPDGLSMDSSGNITGTPTTPGNSNFTVQVSDGTVTCQKQFSVGTNDSGGGGCPFFADILWGPPDIEQDNGTASGAFLANTFAFDVNATNPPLSSGNNKVDCTGTLTNPDGEITCTISGIITDFSTTDLVEGAARLDIRIDDTTNSNILLNEQVQALGPFSFTFTIPAGVDISVRINAHVGLHDWPVDSGTIIVGNGSIG